MKNPALMLILLLAASPVAAQVYKWTDEQGRVQYGEKPPPGAKSSSVKPPSGPGSGSAKPADLGSQERAFQQRQVQRREGEEQQAAEGKLNQQRCEYSKNELASNEQASVVYRREKGEKVYLDDAQRRENLAQLRAQVSRYCR